MDYSPAQLAPTLRNQIQLPANPNSKSTVEVTCVCGTQASMNYRSFLRKWRLQPHYLCKSCHVKGYVSDPDRVEKFKASFTAAVSDEHRQRCSSNGQKAWADPDRRQRLIGKISADNKTNPKKRLARQKALESLQGKSWFNDHLDRMREIAVETTLSNAPEFIEKARIVHGDHYDYSQVIYANSITDVVIVCPEHGAFTQIPHNHLRGKGCRKCAAVLSGPHRTVIDMLPPGLEININHRETLAPFEIDIWIPRHKVGIEINGEYWHGIRDGMTKTEMKYHRLRHLKKALAAQSAGIKLFQFWAQEIQAKPGLISSMIHNAIRHTTTIYARDCQKAKLNNSTMEPFFTATHLQGHRQSLLNYALTHNGHIVCGLSISRHPKYQWEIMRYSVAVGHSVPGGFSRLLKMFEQEYNPQQILSFADRRISIGNLYVQNGFQLITNTQPNYFYHKRGQKLSRQQCQKSKLKKLLGDSFDPSRTEVENMLRASYIQIFDAGHCKLVKNRVKNANDHPHHGPHQSPGDPIQQPHRR